jgi:hypothetical protein
VASNTLNIAYIFKRQRDLGDAMTEPRLADSTVPAVQRDRRDNMLRIGWHGETTLLENRAGKEIWPPQQAISIAGIV